MHVTTSLQSPAIDPGSRYALLRRAGELFEARQLDEADALCLRWLACAPDDAETIYLRSLIARDAGRLPEALTMLDNAIGRPEAAPSWQVTRALVLLDLGRAAEALDAVEIAIAADVDTVEAHIAHARSLMALRRPAEALISLDRVLAREPDNVGATLYATTLQLEISEPEAGAPRRIDAELAVRPDDARSHLARAQAMRAMNRLDEALAACDAAIECQDDYPRAWFVKCLLLLTLGRYAEGWPLYEWRWLTPESQNEHPTLPQPLWDGSPLGGRSLLVIAEQGLGDTIQLYRFLAGSRNHAQVTLHVPPTLVRLFSGQQDAPLTVADGAAIPRTDVYCMMGSLPWLLGVETHSIPAAPYLRAEPTWVGQQPPPRPRVGIVWAGNPAHADDLHRSMPLRTLLDMLDPALTVVSLQKDVPQADRATLDAAGNVLDLGCDLTDFADTAAVMAGLDLIISVDTASAHLAGALGRPVWLLLAFAPDWRWLLDREDSPWYPSARLFRQDRPGDWTGVAHRVREALRDLLAAA